jgi:cellobiose phosphorylase
LACAHQFREGDVLHWWHPPTDKGVRTRFSDDLLWLAYVTDRYIEVTGDDSILDEQVAFIEGPVLEEGVDDIYMSPTISSDEADLYTHCCLAIDRSLKTGVNGLPLMGSGDWNDGMSEVGNKGKGESVWMGWFLASVISNFVKYCKNRRDQERVTKYTDHLTKLENALHSNGWDGKWFRRAFFDDGTPLGSKENEECIIDSIAQSWSVLSGIGRKEYTSQALESAKKHLVKKDQKMSLLFTPPFEKTQMNPGYIKSYLPGVRENGGQYTHAACWLAMAFGRIGQSNFALELFRMLNPINHSLDKAHAELYKTEPYSIVADIYSNPLHYGRGGWSWYTGSSALYYSGIIETILGINIRGQHLHLNPSLGELLLKFEFSFVYKTNKYKVLVEKTGKSALFIEGEKVSEELVLPLKDESKSIEVRFEIP